MAEPTRQDLDELETVEIKVNMGPQHPSTHGVFRMVLTIDGEKIVDCVPHIGYLHRGSEKVAEGEQFHQVVTLFDRLDYLANFNNELVYCMAVEKVMGLQAPERAQYIRVLLSELQRIASHFLLVSSFGLDTGALTPGLYAFRGRERILMLFEAVSGARMMHNYFHIGGVKDDLPEDFDKRLGELLPILKFDIEECDKLLSFNEVFLARTRGVGVIDTATAIDYGMTGCGLRATGLAYDVRKAQPYSSYEKFDFDIPTGQHGDCWDRYWMRVQEMYQSLRIVEQAWKQMPKGPVNAIGRRLLRPPKGEAYVRAENPRGEIGVYLVTDGTDKPYRLKVRPPSYCNLVALQHMLKNQYLADCVVIFGSLDIVLGEVDR